MTAPAPHPVPAAAPGPGPADPAVGGGRRRRGAWIWGLVVLAAAVAGLFPWLQKEPSELPVYVTGAARMLEGAPVHVPEDAKPFTYPPGFALPFVPLAMLPEGAHRPVWYVVNLLLLGWILFRLDGLLGRLAAAAGRRPRRVLGIPHALVWTGVALLAARHVLAVFQNQSHDLFLGLVVVEVAVAWCAGRTLLAGLWAGAGAALKATPLLFLVPFAVQLRGRALLGLGVGAVALTFLPDLLFPAADGRSWAVAWYETFVGGLQAGGTADRSGTWEAASYLNQSLSGTLYRLTTPTEAELAFVRDASVVSLDPDARRMVTLGMQALVAGIVALVAVQRSPWWPVGRPRPADPEPGPGEHAMRRLAEVGAVACGMVLLSPMSSKSHFNVLLVPVVFVVVDFWWRRRDPVLGALLLAVLAVGTLSTKGVWGRETGNVLLSYGTVTWGTFLLLAAVAHAAWLPRRRRRPLDRAAAGGSAS